MTIYGVRPAGRITTTSRTGAFAGTPVFTNHAGEGIFTRRADGSIIQHTGTGQTPQFRTPRQLAAWLRRHYWYDARPAIVLKAKGWDPGL